MLDALPERLTVGVGAHGRLQPDPAVIAELERRGVTVRCLHTDVAVRRYVKRLRHFRRFDFDRDVIACERSWILALAVDES